MFSGCGSSSSTAALSCLTTACQPSSLRASVDACALSLKAELGLSTLTGREDRHRDVAVTPPLQEVISSCSTAADHCVTAEDDTTTANTATAAALPAVAGVPISHLRRISRAANQQGSGTHLPHSGATQQHPHLPAQPPADQHKAQSRLASMEQRFPTPPPAYKQGNMVVIVQQGAEAAGHPQADAGGQMTLGSGLPMQYQQQQAPQQQQYQHNMQQGYVAQVAVPSQLQPVQQQQPYQVQAGVVLGTQQALQQQPQQQQQAPTPQGEFQGQYAATSLQAADQQQQEQQQLQQQLHQQQVQQHQQQMQLQQQQAVQLQQVQQQAQQQHMQQQAALSAYAAAAGQHPAQQQPAQRQGSANGAPMMRQSGSSAGGVVRQEVVLPAAGSAGVLAELDQLAAAVQVTPQPQAQQQQAHAPQQQQQQQVPFQATPQQQLQAQQQQFQQPAAQQAQQGYGQQGQQPRRSWEQPPDLVPLQLQQQQGDAVAQRTPMVVGSQGMQHQQQPQQLPQQQQHQQQQAPAGDGMVLVQQHPPTPQLGAQAMPGQQVQVQAVQHAQLASQLQHQQQQQQGGPQQHVVLQGVTVSAGSSAYGTATPMQLSGHGVYDAATAPPADGQAWAGPSDVKQQPQLQPQPQQLQAPMQQALPQLLQQQPQQQAEQQVLVHNLVQLQPQLLQLQGQQAQGPALPQAQLVQLQGQQAQQQQQHGMPVSPQCWGGPLAVVAQKLPSDGVVQPGSPLTFLAGNQQVVLQPQQQAPQQQQAVDVLAALQPNGATWDATALQMQQQQQQQPQPQLQPQHLQQLQLTPQQQQQAQFVDLVMVQQQQQQPQQVVVVSGAMVAMPVAMPTPAVQVVPSPSPLQQQQQQQLPQQQAQQPVQGGLMLPPAPRAAVAAAPQQQMQQQPQQQQVQPPQQQQAQQAQQAQAAVPPWRQAGGEVTASGITTAAIDREIPWSELQFGHQIGEGGFGKVYYGTWRSQAVAIKVLNPQSADSAKLMSEFNREVSTMTRLPEHPNVLKLLGVCTTPPNLALVTQFCAKGSLYGLLHSPGCYLSWVQVVAMLLDAAKGMEHLHANSVLHRDLKSGNLLVDQDSSVRVADFGLSRLYHGMHTMTGGLGTFQWMAPEVLANQRYSNKADIYSFGMVMWECCARQVPFEGLNGVQAALAVMSRGMRPEIPQHTPAGLAALMQDCWAPVPEQRPGFDVVVARLQDLLQQLKHAEVTATAAAAANRAAAAITAAATGAAMNASG